MRGCEVVCEDGKVVYSPRVIQKVVEHVLGGIRGVSSLEKSPEESIRVDARREFVSLNLFLIFTLERRVPETAWEIQKRVKEKIEREMFLKVERINIYVQSFEIGDKADLALQGISRV
ncbi:MAG: Asp23/Gls24 family envelope stress response protein [Candidatus Caldatribacterium sp.]|uniref:Asp23/Gls24 family envelope stress response protein n=1 Tax=Candidatus Caldatribacterium sp. TaxID=2282143 RepID=UPI00299B5AAA|nr:Asp23/Gls24 family envelope stress response protein [Candidatus Caldatribacterium sp.]MCX7730781.1 Asp23/Gls24 family envelope stress response protein [Candidatus Caldatribacterium sp.]MDW8080782.1 Asp23/Gls24 family envelope stress response protein [Candidatus Calescibacterium sp.]